MVAQFSMWSSMSKPNIVPAHDFDSAVGWLPCVLGEASFSSNNGVATSGVIADANDSVDAAAANVTVFATVGGSAVANPHIGESGGVASKFKQVRGDHGCLRSRLLAYS